MALKVNPTLKGDQQESIEIRLKIIYVEYKNRLHLHHGKDEF
jgi:hypothetical protein